MAGRSGARLAANSVGNSAESTDSRWVEPWALLTVDNSAGRWADLKVARSVVHLVVQREPLWVARWVHRWVDLKELKLAVHSAELSAALRAEMSAERREPK